MIELTLARTKELLAEAVAEKGADFVYVNRYGRSAGPDNSTTCHYVHDDQPGCIVGNVLHRAGVSLYNLSEHEGENAESPVTALFRPEPGVVDLLREVQSRQDKGASWSEAVRLALAELESSA